MKRILFRSLFLLTALVVFAANVCAQGTFVYSNNNLTISGGNTVGAWLVNGDGTLTPVPGQPFLTGGTGGGIGYFASNRMALYPMGNFLYVSNDYSSDISAFSVDLDTGALTPIKGSPFATGGFGGLGISLAVSRDGSFLFAALGGSNNIRVFAVNGDGSLTAVRGLVPAGGPVDGIAVTHFLNYLLVVLETGPFGQVAVFSWDSGGGLTPVPGSPFTLRSDGPIGVATSVDITCDDSTVVVGEAPLGGTLIDVANLDPVSGALMAIPGSPFTSDVAVNSNVAMLDVFDGIVYVSNQFSNTITAFNVGAYDLLGVFSAGGEDNEQPSGLATDATGSFVATGKFPNSVAIFTVNANGTLSFAADVPTGQPPGLMSVTLYPGKSCF